MRFYTVGYTDGNDGNYVVSIITNEVIPRVICVMSCLHGEKIGDGCRNVFLR